MASPAAAFSPSQARELLHHLAGQVRRTLRHPDETHVHDLRVAIRRFHQALMILKPCLNPENYKDIRATLKGLMIPAGQVRDCDITVTLVGKLEEHPPAAITRLRRRREKELIAALKSWTKQDFAAQWQLQLQPCEDLTAAAARKLILNAITRAAKRVHKRASRIHESLKALHKLRIAAKRLRYTLELAGSPIDTIRDLQTQLGDINDVRSAIALLKHIDAPAPLRKALAKKQRKKVRRFRRDFKEPARAR